VKPEDKNLQANFNGKKERNLKCRRSKKFGSYNNKQANKIKQTKSNKQINLRKKKGGMYLCV